MTRICITGATGFVGLNLITYLSEAGFEITTIDMRKDYDVEELNKAEAIIHLAGMAHDLKNVNNADSYYTANTELTKKIFNEFKASKASVFVTLSSVKAVRDTLFEEILTENMPPLPQTDYGKSKLLAEQYIFDQKNQAGKRVYVLRPCMIHGPGNKGNLNLLFAIVRKGIPYPLAAFNNKRSVLSIENLCFVIQELIVRNDIASGIYNVADDIAISTNRIVEIMSETMSKKPNLLFLNKTLVKTLAKLGDFFYLPLNTERLKKLTENYIVSNEKLKMALCKPLPVNSEDGLRKTFHSFHKIK